MIFLMAHMVDAPASEPAPNCPKGHLEVPLNSEVGSAGLMKNIASHPESIRAIAGDLLKEALAQPRLQKTVDCGRDCTSSPDSQVVYRVEPMDFLAEEDQDEICLTLEQQTQVNPWRFADQQFESVDDINEWVMKFSQGRGEEGKKLYQRCASNCSPRYTFLIAREQQNYRLSTEVKCGLARDKDTDRYQISTALRYECSLHDKVAATPAN